MGQDGLLRHFNSIIAKEREGWGMFATSMPRATRETLLNELDLDSLSLMQVLGEFETDHTIMFGDEELIKHLYSRERKTVGAFLEMIEAKIKEQRGEEAWQAYIQGGRCL